MLPQLHALKKWTGYSKRKNTYFLNFAVSMKYLEKAVFRTTQNFIRAFKSYTCIMQSSSQNICQKA